VARLAFIALGAWAVMAGAAQARDIDVVAGGSIQQAIATAQPGDRVLVHPGTYREHVEVTVPRLALAGVGGPIIDGGGQGSVVLVRAPGVTVRGLHLQGTGRSLNGDDAGIKLDGVRGCTIEDNQLEGVFYGIDLQKSAHNVVRHNRVVGGASKGSFEGWGDGIRAWNSTGNAFEGNDVSGFRDGFYLESAAGTTIASNDAHDNQRYGLHFMFMDDSRFRHNTFRHNQAGTVLMYSKRIVVEDNYFTGNRGSVGDGVLFKENDDCLLRGNHILNNTVGLFLDSSNRNRFERNIVAGNGWGLLLYSSCAGNRFSANAFVANTYEVAVDMSRSDNVLEGNYWSGYRGYDLDGDGRGDTPYCPVSLFSFLAMQYPDLVAFAQSPAVQALSFAQKLLPALAPSTLQDAHPLLFIGQARLARGARR
jgi:nitrous oxidase accessory protein